MQPYTANEPSEREGATPTSCRNTFWLILGLVMFCFLCGFFHVSDVDVGYHMQTGAYISAEHHIPSRNTFSYTVPDEPWLLQQWLPATILYWTHRVGGVAGLITLKACIGALMMLLVWCSARRTGSAQSLWPFWIVTIAVLMARVRFFERGDLFTSAFLALLFYLDLRFERSRRWHLLFMPLVMALWANMHSGVVYGFVFLGALVAADWLTFVVPQGFARIIATDPKQSWRTLMLRPVGIALAMAAALASVQLINPNGWKVLTVPITQATSTFWQSNIVEYFPPTWGNAKLFYVSLAAMALLQIVTLRHLRLRLLLVTAGFGYLACSSQRSICAFAIVAAPHMAYMLARLPRASLAWMPRYAQLGLPVAWAALLALVIVPDRTYLFGPGLYHGYYPTEIFQFIKREVPPQNLFNDMRLGGPMLWTLYPEFKPFIDGRGDAYSENFWITEYLPAAKGEERWKEIFARHNVTGALLSLAAPTSVPRLGNLLFNDPDWALVAFNDETLLFLKRTEANRPLIERHSFSHLWPGNCDFSIITAASLPEMAPEAARAWELYPGLYAHSAAARCAMAKVDFKSASEFLATVVTQAGASEAHWRDYAFCLYKAGEYGQAERVLADMIKRRLNVGFAYYMKHFIALQHRDLAEARNYISKAVQAEPANAEYQEAARRLESNQTTAAGRRPS